MFAGVHPGGGRLKRQKTVPEKDAKAIFMQIMSGLRYLNRPLAYLGKLRYYTMRYDIHTLDSASFAHPFWTATCSADHMCFFSTIDVVA